MHSTLLVIENLTSDSTQYGWLLNEIEKTLRPHTEAKFLSKNVLLLPAHVALLAISEIDAQCRVFSAQPGQSFAYKCLFLGEEPEWIYSNGLVQKTEPE